MAGRPFGETVISRNGGINLAKIDGENGGKSGSTLIAALLLILLRRLYDHSMIGGEARQ
jgi:hypothetical protein